MALKCPHCAVEMREVKAEATTGYLLLLDQCPQCGGIWCDRWELFPLSTAAAERIDAVDPATVSHPLVPVTEQRTCPRCCARMRSFQDRMLPPDTYIERCLNCEGMWLNRGELRRLKAPGGSRAVPAADADRLATKLRASQSWPAVENLDSAMQEPLPIDSPAGVADEMAHSAAWLALRALLRLVLHV